MGSGIESVFGEFSIEDDEFFEDKMLRDLGNSTAQTYILEYGRHDQKSSINDASRTMKTEIGTTDTNNAGREYQFQ